MRILTQLLRSWTSSVRMAVTTVVLALAASLLAATPAAAVDSTQTSLVREAATSAAASQRAKSFWGKRRDLVSGWATLGAGFALRGARVSLETLGGKSLCRGSAKRDRCGDKGMRTDRFGGFSWRARKLPSEYVIKVRGGRIQGTRIKASLLQYVNHRFAKPGASLAAVTPATTVQVRLLRADVSKPRAVRAVRRSMGLEARTSLGHDVRVSAKVFNVKKFWRLARKHGVSTVIQRHTQAALRGGKGWALGKGEPRSTAKLQDGVGLEYDDLAVALDTDAKTDPAKKSSLADQLFSLDTVMNGITSWGKGKVKDILKSGLQWGISQLSPDFANFLWPTSPVQAELARISEELEVLQAEVSELEQEISGAFTALSADIDESEYNAAANQASDQVAYIDSAVMKQQKAAEQCALPGVSSQTCADQRALALDAVIVAATGSDPADVMCQQHQAGKPDVVPPTTDATVSAFYTLLVGASDGRSKGIYGALWDSMYSGPRPVASTLITSQLLDSFRDVTAYWESRMASLIGLSASYYVGVGGFIDQSCYTPATGFTDDFGSGSDPITQPTDNTSRAVIAQNALPARLGDPTIVLANSPGTGTDVYADGSTPVGVANQYSVPGKAYWRVPLSCELGNSPSGYGDCALVSDGTYKTAKKATPSGGGFTILLIDTCKTPNFWANQGRWSMWNSDNPWINIPSLFWNSNYGTGGRTWITDGRELDQAWSDCNVDWAYTQSGISLAWSNVGANSPMARTLPLMNQGWRVPVEDYYWPTRNGQQPQHDFDSFWNSYSHGASDPGANALAESNGLFPLGFFGPLQDKGKWFNVAVTNGGGTASPGNRIVPCGLAIGADRPCSGPQTVSGSPGGKPFLVMVGDVTQDTLNQYLYRKPN